MTICGAIVATTATASHHITYRQASRCVGLYGRRQIHFVLCGVGGGEEVPLAALPGELCRVSKYISRGSDDPSGYECVVDGDLGWLCLVWLLCFVPV